MSRGRPRHQASRRRTYSARQREVRERQARAAREERSWEVGPIVPIEVDDETDADIAPGWPMPMPLSRRAPAA